MKLKNYDLEYLITFLDELELSGKESRMRSRFMKLIKEKYDQFKTEHQTILTNYSRKDEKGNPIVLSDEKGQRYDIENIQAFQSEFLELINEDCVIDINSERQEMYSVVSKAILECDKVFKGVEADAYDRICQIFENEELK